MNAEQRILTALRCEQPDRVPVLIYFNPYVEDWYTHLPSYAEVLSAAEEYADVVFKWDFPSPLMFTTAQRWIEQRDLGNGQTEHIIHTPDGPITEVARAGWRGHEVVKRWIASDEDARRVLSMPYAPSRPDLETFFDIKVRLGGRAVAQATFPEPAGLVDWIDEHLFTRWYAERRGLARQLLDTAFERIADGLTTCLEAGVGPVYVLRPAQGAQARHLSGEEFDEFVVEYDRRLVELIHRHDETYVILQSHGRIGPHLDRLPAIGMDGLEVIEPPISGDCSLAQVKDRLGRHVCLIATLPYEELSSRSTPEIERLVRKTLAAGAPGGGFLLSPCPVPGDRDLPAQASSNLIHYLKTAYREGQYADRSGA
jgi:hypothetical protein